MLEVSLLGSFDIKYKKKPVSIASRPAQTLFAYLILSAGTLHRRERLAGLLWPDSLEETARDNLRHALWRIRKALPAKQKNEYVLTDDLSIAFNAFAEYWLDVSALEKVGDDASADELISVLSAYQGELLPGFYDEWVMLEREHINSVFDHKMARLMSVLQDENRWLDILDWGERWIKLGQKPEPAYRALMSAHAAMGDMSKVAAIYERCVKSLKEFGVEPSEQTKELFQSLKSGKEIPKPVIVSPKSALPEVPSNIPVPLTSFIGREKELKEITRLLSSSRLVTLTGSGGVGKTRLAVQTANDSIKKFKDGVFWVGLVGLSDENLISQEIAQSLNVREVSHELIIETLKTNLKSKDLLIVLDNCEHMIKACAQYVEQLLASCTKLKILATSIEALGIFNETVWQVPSLPLPEMQQSLSLKELQEFASIELFDERASNAKSGFVLDARNANTVAQICRRLDGIPLAIELAAARIKVLSVGEIASRLDDRFSLLTAGSRTAVPRHQTLRATIDWSYDLLIEPERVLLRRLSVFASGFTLESAEEICNQGMKRSDILDLLGHLVDKSLVIVEEVSKNSETRYRLLETIREYGREKLKEIGETEMVYDQHLAYYVRLAQVAEPHIFGEQTARWFTLLDLELDNIRLAIDWSIQHRKMTEAFLLLGSLDYFFFVHGPISEWQECLQHALSMPGGQEKTLARAKALNGLSMLYWADINPLDDQDFQEALEIALQLGEKELAAKALRNLGLFEHLRGNLSKARALLEQSRDIWLELGPPFKLQKSWTLNFLGDVAFSQGDLNQALLFFEQSTAIFREFKDKAFLAYAVRRLAQLAVHRGNPANAILLCRESLLLNMQVNDPRGILACISAFAGIQLSLGRFASAGQLFSAVQNLLSQRALFRLLQIDQLEYDRNLALLKTKLDEKTLARFWSKGMAMTREEAIAFALEETQQ